MALAEKKATTAMAASISFPRPSKAINSKLLGGSLTLLAGSGLVGITNFLYNVATARMLGPTGFANATAVYTLLMLMSAITLTYQVVAAKYVAKAENPAQQAAVFRTLHRQAWFAATTLGLLLLVFKAAITAYLNLPNSFLVVLLALGTVFYIPLGVRRGYLQGIHAFGHLAVNFLLEGIVRLGGAVLLIAIGWGVRGAVLASAAGVIVSYLFASTSLKSSDPSGTVFIPIQEGVQAIVFFAGQVVINNFDILLVKHFFSSDQAGVYAAVSLVGRVVNMCAWSVVNTMFPVSAGVRSSDRDARPVLLTSLFLVFLILAGLILGLSAVPSFLWRMIFGAHLGQGNYGGLTALLILYAVTTGIYSLTSVIITYEMSRKIANTSWVQLAFSGALIAGICAAHNTLREVILVQLVLVITMLVAVALPLLRKEVGITEAVPEYPSLHIQRTLSEHEVIALFLQSEFHHPEFTEYQEFRHVVMQPDFGNERENALRRALLFLRRGPMWRELPEDTRWFQVSLAADDLMRIRFFPRAQWRRVAQGSFYLTDMIEALRVKWGESSSDEFFQKLHRMTNLVQDSLVDPAVLLIGVDRNSPLTILDGNHRVAAAMLAQPPASLENFKFICGLSPAMTRCCWYRTNVNTLWRYMTNLVRHLFHDPESDIGRFQEDDSQLE